MLLVASGPASLCIYFDEAHLLLADQVRHRFVRGGNVDVRGPGMVRAATSGPSAARARTLDFAEIDRCT
jgi:hypothetical protein